MIFRRYKKPEIGDGLRTCEVDGDKAFFHRWVVGGIMGVRAIIEYIDGTVDLVQPERVRFTDR